MNRTSRAGNIWTREGGRWEYNGEGGPFFIDSNPSKFDLYPKDKSFVRTFKRLSTALSKADEYIQLEQDRMAGYEWDRYYDELVDLERIPEIQDVSLLLNVRHDKDNAFLAYGGLREDATAIGWYDGEDLCNELSIAILYENDMGYMFWTHSPKNMFRQFNKTKPKTHRVRR